MAELSSIFDMIGPVMIGPSSSHTAGVARIGRAARKILGAQPKEVTITYYNSFAGTYEGHGSDRAILAGLLDYAPDDERIRNSIEIATELGIVVNQKAYHSAPKLHPNTIRVHAANDENSVEVLGVSRGGGLITIQEVNGFHANLNCQSPTLFILAKDTPGSIAFIASAIAAEECNIATMIVTRRAKEHDAMLIIESDNTLKKVVIDYLSHLRWVKKVTYVAEF